MGISTIRYLPPMGTAGFDRSFVNGNRRVPAPPPMMIDNVRCVVPGGSAGGETAPVLNDSGRERLFVATGSINAEWARGHQPFTNLPLPLPLPLISRSRWD